MIDKNKIRNIIELFIAWNGETEPIDVANIDSAVEFIGSSLQEEPVSEELDDIASQLAQKYFPDEYNIWARPNIEAHNCKNACIEMANWQKEQIEEILLSEVLPCFMHSGEADEVVAKLDEVLNQKK